MIGYSPKSEGALTSPTTRIGISFREGNDSSNHDCHLLTFTASEGQIYLDDGTTSNESGISLAQDSMAESTSVTEHYTTEEGYTQYQVYGNSNTVQPPAIRVYAWKRTI